jgi:poly-gamma-glutamate synthesis protein (capsule biosynthesis protein)
MANKKTKILFTGDLAPVGHFESKPGSPATGVISEKLIKTFEEFDLRITNLECPLTESNNKIEKTGPHLKAHPNSIQLLVDLNINVAALSNNHVRDFGTEGVMDTIKFCQKNGIKTVGAGKNAEEASRPLFINLNGKTLAILNFSESEYSDAGKDFAGSNPDDTFQIWNSIKNAKEQSDFQIVILHGGKEMHPYPTPYQLKQFRFVADQGVHAVIGHHTHVIGGYEIYNGIPIVYSLGNFIFDEDGNSSDWYKGALAGISIDEQNNFELELFQVHLENKTIQIVDHFKVTNASNGNKFIQNIDDGQVAKEWEKLTKKQSIPVAKLLLNLSLFQRVLNKLGLFKYSNKDKRFLLALGNRYRCRTHRLFTVDSITNFLTESK